MQRERIQIQPSRLEQGAAWARNAFGFLVVVSYFEPSLFGLGLIGFISPFVVKEEFRQYRRLQEEIRVVQIRGED